MFQSPTLILPGEQINQPDTDGKKHVFNISSTFLVHASPSSTHRARKGDGMAFSDDDVAALMMLTSVMYNTWMSPRSRPYCERSALELCRHKPPMYVMEPAGRAGSNHITSGGGRQLAASSATHSSKDTFGAGEDGPSSWQAL